MAEQTVERPPNCPSCKGVPERPHCERIPDKSVKEACHWWVCLPCKIIYDGKGRSIPMHVN